MSETPPSEGVKIKQTRRRQRLSCVECTKRRQRCDRKTPCGLCVTRGVPHLCRWEPIMARPTPQRPPGPAATPTGRAGKASENTVEALSKRIAVLEQTILQQNLKNSQRLEGHGQAAETAVHSHEPLLELTEQDAIASQDPNACGVSEKASLYSAGDVTTAQGNQDAPLDLRCVAGPRALYDYKVQAAAVALAQLSLAPREEYIGGGTILCALHKLGNPDTWRFPYSKSNLTTSPVSVPQSPRSHPLLAPVRALLANLPSRQRIAELVDAFFRYRNWELGLPETWFRNSCAKMWFHLDVRCPGGICLAPASCTFCGEEINPHWIALIFAVIALAPRNVSKDSSVYFTHALSAKRLAEDILLAVPAYSISEKSVHGAVLNCIATALLAAYLSDNGRVSEAWKLAGNGLRSAQAMGLHRDPSWRKWEAMGKDEAELRDLGWWLLFVADRMYSLILGRPMMAAKGTYDVTLLPGPRHADGTPNPYVEFQQAFVKLCEVIGDGVERCLGIQAPSYATILDVDNQYKRWLSQLPAHLHWQGAPLLTESTTLEQRNLNYQRQSLAAYYLGSLMNIHRPYQMIPRPMSSVHDYSRAMAMHRESRDRCIYLSAELVQVLCNAHEDTPEWAASPPATLFHYAYFVFDGAVSLVGALAQTPPHPRQEECLELIDCALKMLRACVAAAQGTSDGEGEIARRAIAVLEALRAAGGWDQRRRGNTDDGSCAYQPVAEEMQRIAESNTRTVIPDDETHHGSCGLPYDSGLQQHMLDTLPSSSLVVQAYPTSDVWATDVNSTDLGQVAVRFTGQNTITPFEMLQVSGDPNVDWARLVGMDDWLGGETCS
ncbi:hypothetical protein WOLCODRAFT_103068 [Wolfiporia cocos MD-104 SS10]|uniref:Zn(2)-C6 fungal-type domain-containing protein n=1 Tax=Wolfiporia cocos (strain MD-104) TaxID=742152 RepID=A0A2H3JT13_WOLCO|nr:hypothetical protein WOLCODRAFT_103068 [Wolfiporia cocos MD-104 SS10]